MSGFLPEPAQSKVVLITGCSSGFGLHTAARLAAKGYLVVATMRDLKKQNALLNEVQRRGGRVTIMSLDVTDEGSIKNTVKQIAAKYGHLDVLVNNAGYGIGGFFEDLTQDEIRGVMETNFFGAQNVTRAVIPLMRQHGKGKIINISSVSGFSTSPAFGAYNASKWALEAFSESLHYELKLFGIDVCLIEPGTYRTRIFDENARYAAKFDHPDSPYYEVSRHLRSKVLEHVADCHKDIEEVPALVEKLIISRNPSFRNIPDIESQVLYALRKILPFRLYSALITRVLFHDFKKTAAPKK